MSYLVLARKWRPRTFADTVGQSHVLQALGNALDSGRLHHAYLFSGTRGVGKTTIARILAKALNCEKGVVGDPCGVCGACVEIDEGRFVDLIEVDAASKTKVDDTRELLDNVPYAPAHGRFKVYLIDEVHMLSKSSFNALLKTLEEPPPHVKFLLATTEPDKVPVTVLSRCLQFNLSRLTPRLIADRLAHICEQEEVDAETPALQLLARAADGSLRDALSLLDQAIAYCGGKVEEKPVTAMLGTIDRQHVTRLVHLLAAGDGAGILQAIREIDEQFPDYARLLEDLARLLQRIAICQVIGQSPDEDDFDTDELKLFAEALSAADVQLYYQIALLGQRDLRLAPDPRSGAEMTLLRMLAFKPAGAGRGDSGGGADSSRAPGRSAGSAGRRDDAVAPAARKTALAWRDPDWAALIPALGLKGAVRMLAINCAYLRRDGATLYFTADSKAEAVYTRERRDTLAQVLSEHFDEPLGVDITFAETADGRAETPVQAETRRTGEQYDAARASIESDPNVQALRDMFGAELKTETIEPINPPAGE